MEGFLFMDDVVKEKQNADIPFCCFGRSAGNSKNMRRGVPALGVWGISALAIAMILDAEVGGRVNP